MIVGSLVGVAAGARAVSELKVAYPSGAGVIDVSVLLLGAYIIFLTVISHLIARSLSE